MQATNTTKRWKKKKKQLAALTFYVFYCLPFQTRFWRFGAKCKLSHTQSHKSSFLSSAYTHVHTNYLDWRISLFSLSLYSLSSKLKHFHFNYFLSLSLFVMTLLHLSAILLYTPFHSFFVSWSCFKLNLIKRSHDLKWQILKITGTILIIALANRKAHITQLWQIQQNRLKPFSFYLI